MLLETCTLCGGLLNSHLIFPSGAFVFPPRGFLRRTNDAFSGLNLLQYRLFPSRWDAETPLCLTELGYCAGFISGGTHPSGRKHHFLISQKSPGVFFSFFFNENEAR